MGIFNKSPAEKLAQAKEKVAAFQGTVAELKKSHANELHDAEKLGYAASARRAAALVGDLKIAEGNLALATKQLHELQAEIDKQAEAEQAEKVLRAKRSIPILAKEHMELALKVREAARTLAAAGRELLANNTALRDAIILAFPNDSAEPQRLLRPDYATMRIRELVWPDLMIDASKSGAWSHDNHILGMPAPQEHNSNRVWLVEAEQNLLDAAVRVYASLEDALAARHRIDPKRGASTLHVKFDAKEKLYHLVGGRRRGRAIDDAETPTPPAAV